MADQNKLGMRSHMFWVEELIQSFRFAEYLVRTVNQSKNFVKIPEGPTENLRDEYTDEIGLEGMCSFENKMEKVAALSDELQILHFKMTRAATHSSFSKDMFFPPRKVIRRNEVGIEMNNNRWNKLLEDNDEILYNEVALDHDGKSSGLFNTKINATAGKGRQGEKEEKEEPMSPKKRKKTVQRYLFFVTVTILFLWITLHTSNIELQPEHEPVIKWSSLLEPFGFIVFCLVAFVTIAFGAPFSRFQSAMLMFWAILMHMKSAKSNSEAYAPILGILLTGYYMVVEKQPPHEG